MSVLEKKISSDEIKRRRKIRRDLLKRLIKQIEQGEFSNIRVDPNRIYQLYESVRHEYKSPADRDTYNYGYMELDEMPAGTPNEW